MVSIAVAVIFVSAVIFAVAVLIMHARRERSHRRLQALEETWEPLALDALAYDRAFLPDKATFVPARVAWTECPESSTVLGIQRDRWQRELAQVVLRHRWRVRDLLSVRRMNWGDMARKGFSQTPSTWG